MIKRFSLLLSVVCLTCVAEERIAHQYKPLPLDELVQAARGRLTATSRVPLASSNDDNYARALALAPGAVNPFKSLFRAALFTGGLDPEVKEAMGVRISQLLQSPYISAHMVHLLRATPRGQYCWTHSIPIGLHHKHRQTSKRTPKQNG